MHYLSLDTYILTEEGLKLIGDVKVNESIYSFNPENNELIIKKCKKNKFNGEKEVYRLKTLLI